MKLSWIARFLCTLLLAILAMTGTAQELSTKTYIWRWQYTKGQSWTITTRLDFVAQVMVANIPISVELNLYSSEKARVLSVSSEGNATIEVIDGPGRMVYNGEEIALKDDNGKKSLFLGTKDGTYDLIKTESTAEDDIDKLRPVRIALPAPKKPVRVDEKWENRVNNLFVPGTKIALTSRITEVEHKLGKTLLTIELSGEVPRKEGAEGREIIKYSNTYVLDPEAGRIKKEILFFENIQISVPQLKEPLKVDFKGIRTIVYNRATADITKPSKRKHP